MTQTNLTRSGSFDPTKLGILESRLNAAAQAAGLTGKAQVYGTDTGLLAIYPDSLTAQQQTAAQNIINAYVQPTDTSLLSAQLKAAMTYLAIANPTATQTNNMVKGIVRYLVQQATGKDKIDGTDVSG